ncbi:MAG: hypothetical protein GKR89_03670 [Candidatus Latescibacteria bacterium]|nr:hypothetical protein [Candidatus Latescibacterota bacterium]
MPELAHVGDFCPHETCPDYGQLQSASQTNINKYGQTKQGRQRYRCGTCGQTFSQRKGTLFYGLRTNEAVILETLALLAEGVRISTLSRVKGHKEDTIRRWLHQAGTHAQAVEARLLADYSITRGQLDGLWSYVGHKGQKKATKKPTRKARSGARR